MQAAPLLEVKDLQVRFRVSRSKEVTAVDHVSFQVAPGETLGIVGESGCGKSVTASSILRLLPQGLGRISNGQILFHQTTDLVSISNREMDQIRGSKISMIFQEPMTSLNPVYTIGKQMCEMIRAHSRISRRDAMNLSIEMLGKVGIPMPQMKVSNYPHQLSGGQRQRVMIAMAMACQPELLIADEPTTALDVTIQAQILDLMQELKHEQNASILMITHDMGVIAELADKVMVMYAGRVVEYGTAVDIFDHPLHPYTIGLLKSIPSLYETQEKLYTIEGNVPALDAMPAGCRFSTRCPYAEEQCHQCQPPTEDCNGHQVSCFNWRAFAASAS